MRKSVEVEVLKSWKWRDKFAVAPWSCCIRAERDILGNIKRTAVQSW